ncbi:MAG: hypothetical protein KF893_04150 [Caldilineaceae bacterium]|nr:hypothetical protein [Caldilineaceae bacterium]
MARFSLIEREAVALAVIIYTERDKPDSKICPSHHTIGRLRRCFIDHGTEAI